MSYSILFNIQYDWCVCVVNAVAVSGTGVWNEYEKMKDFVLHSFCIFKNTHHRYLNKKENGIEFEFQTEQKNKIIIKKRKKKTGEVEHKFVLIRTCYA